MLREVTPFLTVAAALFACGAHASAAIVISEVLYNEVGSDTTGEWVELQNTGAAAVDISNYKIGDEETKGGDSESGGMWQFPENTSIQPGQVLVVGVAASRFKTVYGVAPSFELSGGSVVDDASVPNMRPYLDWVNPAELNNMSNSNDQAVLLDAGDNVADAVSWGNTFAFDPGLNATVLDGQSYRRVSTTDTDTAADWEATPDTGVAATRSGPFVAIPAAVPEPATLSALAGVAAMAIRRGRRR